MAKPKIVLTTVGTLIVHKLAENERPLWEGMKGTDLLTLREGNARKQRELEKRLIGRLCELDFSKPSGLHNLAPELTSLAAISVGPGDEVALFASESAAGIFTARLVAQFVKQVWHASAELEVITGLQVKDARLFRSVGVPRYVQSVIRWLSRPGMAHTHDVILNASAGYKSLVPYTTLLGLIFGVPVQYAFESSDIMLTVPPVPLTCDRDLLGRVEPLLTKLDAETELPQQEVLGGLNGPDRDVLVPLLEMNNGKFTFSALGLAVYERFKSPPPLAPSTRPAKEKDQTRNWDKVPNRSQNFEKFKIRLAECQWVESFRYLNGVDGTRRQVKRVGQNLHVAYDGVGLEVGTMARHDDHYPHVQAAILNLME
jgi:putative CRISPR-associated protein (TIGR02619 family)